MLYYSSLFTLTQSLLDLRSFGANLALLRLRFLGGTFGQVWWPGLQKHYSGPRVPPPSMEKIR